MGIQPDMPMKNSFVAISDQQTENESNEEATLPTGNGLEEAVSSNSSVDSVIRQLQPNAAPQNQVAQTPAQTQPENRSTDKPVDTSAGRMPDFRGRGARSAAEICAQIGVKVVAKGSGVVVDQNPKAGTPLQAGTDCYPTLSK